jgi:hypothetical protein
MGERRGDSSRQLNRNGVCAMSPYSRDKDVKAAVSTIAEVSVRKATGGSKHEGAIW